MRVSILAVGPTKSGPEHELVRDYARRFGAMAGQLGLSGLEVKTVKSGGGLVREGERLLAKRPAGAKLIRLDEHGKSLASTALADKLTGWRDIGQRDVVFIIGGAEGYSDPVRQAAPDTLALGPQTWPHLLARAMLCEQLYRAASILAGTPYHKA